MNPYLHIAREHLTTDELKMLLAEREQPEPKRMTKEQERSLSIQKRIQKLF